MRRDDFNVAGKVYLPGVLSAGKELVKVTQGDKQRVKLPGERLPLLGFGRGCHGAPGSAPAVYPWVVGLEPALVWLLRSGLNHRIVHCCSIASLRVFASAVHCNWR